MPWNPAFAQLAKSTSPAYLDAFDVLRWVDRALGLIALPGFLPTKFQPDQTQAKRRPNRVHQFGRLAYGTLRGSKGHSLLSPHIV